MREVAKVLIESERFSNPLKMHLLQRKLNAKPRRARSKKRQMKIKIITHLSLSRRESEASSLVSTWTEFDKKKWSSLA
jgi:hypothetical protein